MVADICAGSGTTAVAALNTGRRFICFENAPAIYGPAIQRIEQALSLIHISIKEISENWLGKATISMQTDGRTRGQSESYSQNNQRLGLSLIHICALW